MDLGVYDYLAVGSLGLILGFAVVGAADLFASTWPGLGLLWGVVIGVAAIVVLIAAFVFSIGRA